MNINRYTYDWKTHQILYSWALEFHNEGRAALRDTHDRNKSMNRNRYTHDRKTQAEG